MQTNDNKQTLGTIELEKVVHDFVLDICEVMFNRGFTEVNIGAILRLIGLDDVSRFDSDFIVLDEAFEQYLKQKKEIKQTAIPADVTLH